MRRDIREMLPVLQKNHLVYKKKLTVDFANQTTGTNAK